jgi:hypothetical protein
MPRGLRAFADAQPVTYVANALRALTSGSAAQPAVLHALLWSGGLLIVSATLATWRFRRS